MNYELLFKLPEGTFLKILRHEDAHVGVRLVALFWGGDNFFQLKSIPLDANDIGVINYKTRQEQDVFENAKNESMSPDQYATVRYQQQEYAKGRTELYQTWRGVREGHTGLKEIEKFEDHFFADGDLKPESDLYLDWDQLGKRVARHLRLAGQEAAEMAMRLFVKGAPSRPVRSAGVCHDAPPPQSRTAQP